MTHYSINGVEGQRMYDGIPVYSPPYPLYTPRLSNLKNVKYDSSSMDVTLGGAEATKWPLIAIILGLGVYLARR